MRGAATAAMVLDWAFGEPPSALHPTVWMGRAIAAVPRGSFLDGAAALLGVTLASAGIASLVPKVLEPVALKPALSLRALLEAGEEVERALRADDLGEARRLLAYHLVSRDVSNLDASYVAGAAISSLAENLSDSVVAPLLAYRLGGLPAAYAYRAINTADAMLGYHTPELEWFGKPAARTDDVVNWVPARLSALLIAIASGNPRPSLTVARADARRCPSPNGGWPMAAMAGALGVMLVKRGVYTLHAGGRAPTPDDLARARDVTALSAVLATALVEII
ncbi:MAG TPA: adenosylcobinamide-phosphate synthase CbiB [Gemmatimonadaceae bacterium]|nr:adenosylcobinamide-phosphate synthase CbiB [Gemmatimonadaceae bacterium]